MLSKVPYWNLITSFLLGQAYHIRFIILLIQEAGDEEKKEVSNTLRKLRIKYDNINKLVREKERELEEKKVLDIQSINLNIETT